MTTRPQGGGQTLPARSTSSLHRMPTGAERARYQELCQRLVRQFVDQGRITEPETFLTSILTVMLHYPLAIIEQLVDPFTGLASRQNRIPTPYDIRQMAEELMAPIHRARARAAAEEGARAAAAEEAKLAADRLTRPSLEQIEEDCAARGLYFASYRKRCPWLFGSDGKPHGETAETAQKRLGVLPGEWDEIPDRPHQRPS